LIKHNKETILQVYKQSSGLLLNLKKGPYYMEEKVVSLMKLLVKPKS
jgi:hypothetical protein